MTPKERAVYGLSLTGFRSYARFDISLDGHSLFIFGPNGAGKTNLLEALSLFSPGKGLRGASAMDFFAREGEALSPSWSVHAGLFSLENRIELGTGAEMAENGRRKLKIDQVQKPLSHLSDYVSMVWLTPQLDRLFIEGRSDRLRFFDRLVFALYPPHAQHVSSYERALRARMKLLCEESAPKAWLEGLEKELADYGLLIVRARQEALLSLMAMIAKRQSAFVQAKLGLDGFDCPPEDDRAITHMLAGFSEARARDALAGRSLFGPHRQDLAVFHPQKGAANQCSTGEQKALLINLILAQAARLKECAPTQAVLMLLDEVAAHLDPQRRKALFDETHDLALQTIFTGTDRSLFDGLWGRARALSLKSSQEFEFIE